jgi:hypothetical protein
MAVKSAIQMARRKTMLIRDGRTEIQNYYSVTISDAGIPIRARPEANSQSAGNGRIETAIQPGPDHSRFGKVF